MGSRAVWLTTRGVRRRTQNTLCSPRAPPHSGARVSHAAYGWVHPGQLYSTAPRSPSSPFPKLPIPSSPTFRLLPSHHTDTPLISVSTQTDYGILTSLPLNAAELRHQHNKWVTILAVIYLPMPQSQLRTHFHVEVILSLDLLPLRIS